jgi:hypothetical protein
VNEKREILGQWWLPAEPKEQWVGTLLLEPAKSPRLTVTVPKGYFQLPDRQTWPVVLGHDEHGYPITLLFPGSGGNWGGAALSQVKFTAGYAVLGIHLDEAAAFLVHSITIGIQHLYEWSGLSGFIEATQTVEESCLRYKRPDPLVFEISPDLTMELHAAPSGHTSQSERILREDAYICLESTQGLNLPRCLELLTALRQLLHFAVLKPVYLLSLEGLKTGHGYSIEGQFIPQGIKLFNSIIRERVESEIQPQRWTFRFPDVQPRFEQFFTHWLEFCHTFGEALRCYSATVYHRPPDSVEHLCLTQALEAYHGTKYGKHTFANRILALAQQFHPHLAGLVPDPHAFAEQVKDNRNYYTHHDAAIKQRGRVLSGAGLLRLNEKLRLLFQMCVLSEMQIPPDRFIRLRRQLASDIIDYT